MLPYCDKFKAATLDDMSQDSSERTSYELSSPGIRVTHRPEDDSVLKRYASMLAPQLADADDMSQDSSERSSDEISSPGTME